MFLRLARTTAALGSTSDAVPVGTAHTSVSHTLLLTRHERLLEIVPTYSPFASRIQADLVALPFRANSAASAWANRSYIHLPKDQVPLARHLDDDLTMEQDGCTVRSSLRVLLEGLNPSLHAADAGYGFAGPGNRFWPALERADATTVDAARNPVALARRHGIGMTDLVKRATPRADEMSQAEYIDGLDRLDRLCRWLEPTTVCRTPSSGPSTRLSLK
jgi:Uracil DNA glycosylase superfamily